MTLTSTKSPRPVIGSFKEDAGPVGFARKVAQEYAAMENGYHEQLRAFLRNAHHSYQMFLESPGAFDQLKRDPFWEVSRQKPKDLTTSRWILLFIMRAQTSNVRARASKYGKILDHFARVEIRVIHVADRIKALGGVEAAYTQIVAAEQRRSGASADGGMEDEQRPILQRRELRASARAPLSLMGSRWRSKRNHIP